jgi:hypothetical protein
MYFRSTICEVTAAAVTLVFVSLALVCCPYTLEGIINRKDQLLYTQALYVH